MAISAKNIKDPTFREFIHKKAGKGSLEVVEKMLKRKKPMKDEEIAEKLGVKVTEIRTILNRLHYRGIANYNKERDDKSGWYTYTWAIDQGKLVELVIAELEERASKLESEKDLHETYTLFKCKVNCVEIPFEVAAEYNFKCPECGKDMGCADPKTRKRSLSMQLNTIKKKINKFNKEK